MKSIKYLATMMILFVGLFIVEGCASNSSSSDTLKLPLTAQDKKPDSTASENSVGFEKELMIFEKELARCQNMYGKASFCDINSGYINYVKNCAQFKGNQEKIWLCAITYLIPENLLLDDSSKISTVTVTNNEAGTFDIVCSDDVSSELESSKTYDVTLYKNYKSNENVSVCLRDLQNERIHLCNDIDRSTLEACIIGIVQYGAYIPSEEVTEAIKSVDSALI